MNNISGQRFSRLVAIEPVGKYHHDIVWKFRCDCGKVIDTRGWLVTTGRTKSCGCYNAERTRETHALSFGEASFNTIIRDYKYRCKRKHTEFSLDKEDFRKLITGNCFYCGKEPNQKRDNPNYLGEFIYNGIDRLDNTKGYTIENCVTCCRKCNTMKGNLNFDEFKTLIQTICKTLGTYDKQ